MRRAGLIVGALLVIACGDRRDEPPAGSRSSSQASGGSTASSGGGGSGMVSCGDDGVTCESYEAGCSAFPGMQPQWTFLSYETVVEGDARVEFAARTADTVDDLPSRSFHHLSTAASGSDTVPASDPVRLEDKLDAGDLLRPWLELRIRMVNASDGTPPEVIGWDLTFSCVDL